jgi:hypothetical protein
MEAGPGGVDLVHHFRLAGPAEKAPAGLFPVPQLLLHRLPQFLIGDVQIPLRRLWVRMAQQKLNRPQIQPT